MNESNIKSGVQALIDKYEKAVQSGRARRYSEEETKKDFILPLFALLGWDVQDKQEVLMITKKGQAIRFNSDDVRSMGRASYGVIGVDLSKTDEVVALESLPTKGTTTILTTTVKGFGKRTELEEYRVTSRGGKGVITLEVTDRTGDVLTAFGVDGKDSIIATSGKGQTIRVGMKDIRVMGRATQGVRIVDLKDGDKLADVVKVPVADVPESVEPQKTL